MSFSKVKADDFVLVRHTKTQINAALNEFFSGLHHYHADTKSLYKGNAEKGEVREVKRMCPSDNGCFQLKDGGMYYDWMRPDSVIPVVEPDELESFDLEDYAWVMAMSDATDTTKGKFYEVGYDRDYDEYGYYDDVGDFIYSSGRNYLPLTQEQFDLYHEVDAPTVVEADDVPVAEVIPFPTPIRTKFKDLSDKEKGELLLAQHKDKPMQKTRPWDDTKFEDTQLTIDKFDNTVWRIKPQELIDAEKELASAHADNESVVADLESKRAELKALEEKAGAFDGKVRSIQDRIVALNAA